MRLGGGSERIHQPPSFFLSPKIEAHFSPLYFIFNSNSAVVICIVINKNITLFIAGGGGGGVTEKQTIVHNVY